MIGKGYLSILFMVTTIVLLSNINANAQISGKWSADLKPAVGSNSNATGMATLELQDNGQKVKYDVSGSGLGNVSGVVISQMMGSDRAPDVVSLKQASTSGLWTKGSGSASGTFTKSDLIGPLQGKDIKDFVKAISEGNIVFRVMTISNPLGEIVGNVTTGGGAAGNMTAGTGNMTAGAGIATGTAMNATVNATGTAIGEAKNILSTAANATTNATGEVMTKANSVISLASSAGANATQTALDQAKDIMTNVTNNVSNIASNATGAALTEANKLIIAASNASSNATNATGTTMTQPETVVSNATANATNATGTTMTQPETVVSTPANETANATGKTSNQTGNPVLDALKNIFGGLTGNK